MGERMAESAAGRGAACRLLIAKPMNYTNILTRSVLLGAWALALSWGCKGSGASGASGDFAARECGIAVACAAGAKCSYAGIETGVDCECDPSGHYFCHAWAAGGAPSWDSCTEERACGQGEDGESGGGGAGGCSESNGFCVKTCDCELGCTYDECDGEGPAEAPKVVLCEEAYCDTPPGDYGKCSVDDGDCNYAVDCRGEKPELAGSCSL